MILNTEYIEKIIIEREGDNGGSLSLTIKGEQNTSGFFIPIPPKEFKFLSRFVEKNPEIAQ